MAEAVQVRIRDLGQLVPDDVRVAILQRAAAHAVSIIKLRTSRGVDVHGAAFAAYSARWAKLRAGSGRQTQPVNLTLTGAMLASMTVLEITPGRALIGFQGASSPAAFRRMRTEKRRKPTSKKTARGGRITHVLTRATGSQDKPVANSLKAFALHNGTKTIPARPFFDLSEEERRKVIAEAASTLRLRK